jgi:hypothetical protein
VQGPSQHREEPHGLPWRKPQQWQRNARATEVIAILRFGHGLSPRWIATQAATTAANAKTTTAAYATYPVQSSPCETAKLSRNGVGKRKKTIVRKTRLNLSMQRRAVDGTFWNGRKAPEMLPHSERLAR